MLTSDLVNVLRHEGQVVAAERLTALDKTVSDLIRQRIVLTDLLGKARRYVVEYEERNMCNGALDVLTAIDAALEKRTSGESGT